MPNLPDPKPPLLVKVNVDNTVTVIRTCPLCSEERQATYPRAGFEAWHMGVLVQDALPDSSPDDREFLISSLCPKCFGATTEEQE